MLQVARKESSGEDFSGDIHGDGEVKSIHLGNNKYAIVSVYNGEHYFHIRQYEVNRKTGRKYPTKQGISMKPSRFASFYSKLENIQASVKQMLESPSAEMAFKMHIGGGVYVSMDHVFNSVSIRHFFVPEGQTEAKATRYGVSLRPNEWDVLYENMEVIRGTTKKLQEAEMCIFAPDHCNQQGMMMCSECNPFQFANEVAFWRNE